MLGCQWWESRGGWGKSFIWDVEKFLEMSSVDGCMVNAIELYT